MFDLNFTTVGIALIFVGFTFFGLTPLILRVVPRFGVAEDENKNQILPSINLPESEDATLLVEPGGRILHINNKAREWFNLEPGELPNLERMARATRPEATFLELCAGKGQAHLTLNKSLIEGNSYAFPYLGEAAILVTLKRPQLLSNELINAEADESSNGSNQVEVGENHTPRTWTMLAEITQKMSASLDLNTTITTILENVDQLVQSDFSEITLWDSFTGQIKQYRIDNTAENNRALKSSPLETANVSDGYSGQLITERKPILIDNIDAYQADLPHTHRQKYPFKSYLGIPLIAGGSQIGTLELSSQKNSTFTQDDLNLLQMISGQAAIALQNAIVHYEERERTAEIAGLAELANVGTSLSDEHQLFERLTANIGDLVGAGVVGFLLYHPTRRILQGQAPFIGIPDEFIEIYRTRIEEDSEAETVWQAQNMILTADAGTSDSLIKLNIAHLAQAAGITETVLLPLSAGGRSLGYLQVGNKRDGTPFDSDDLRLLSIVANQAAPIIENANLVRDARRRTQRAETLRRIASLTGADATLDEILKFTVMEAGRFLSASQIALYILDETIGEISIHQPSMFNIDWERFESNSRISTGDVRYKETTSATTLPIISHDLQEETLPAIYEPFKTEFDNPRSAMIVPIIIRDRGMGEIVLVSEKTDQYDYNDLQVLTTIASQISNSIERKDLLTQTDKSLQRRVEQLTSLSRISRELNTTSNLNHLLQRVYDEAIQSTGANNGAIIMLDVDLKIPPKERKTILHLGKVYTETRTDAEQQVIAKGSPLIISEYPSSGYTAPHEEVWSSMIVPIAYQNEIAGLIHLYSRRSNYFDKNLLEITQALAIQAAIAYGNAQRYQEEVNRGEMLYRRVSALNTLLETKNSLDLNKPLAEGLAPIAKGLIDSNVFEVGFIYAYDPTYRVLNLIAGAGVSQQTLQELKEVIYPWEHIEKLAQEEYKVGKAFFVPEGAVPNTPPIIPLYAIPYIQTPPSDDNWEEGDQLFIPLYDSQQEPLGVVAVNAPKDGKRPDNLAYEIFEIFTAEAQFILESTQKVATLQSEMGTIESKIGWAEQTSQTAQSNLAILLNKDLEQTIAIQQLYQRAHNIRVGLNIAEIVNQQPDRESVLNSLAHQILTQMNLDMALIVENTTGGPRLIQQIGNIPDNANPSALLGQRNPIRRTIQTAETILCANIEEDETWRDSPLLKRLNAKAFISLPISTQGNIDSVLMAASLTVLPEFTNEDNQIFELVGSQVAIALQNINLLTETRRRLREVNLLLEFSNQLGTLDPNTILENLLESATRVLPNAHAGMALIWDMDAGAMIPATSTGYTENDMLNRLRFKSDQAFPGKIFTERQSQIINDLDFAKEYDLDSDQLVLYREATGGRLPVSSMGVPIRAGENLLGVLILDNFNTPNGFSSDDLALIESITQQTALSLVNAQLFAETRSFNEELEQRVSMRTDELEREHHFTQTMLRISTELSASLDLDHVLNRSLKFLNDALGAEQSSIMITRPGEEFLIYRAGVGITESPSSGGRISSLKVGDGLAGWVISNNKPLVIADLENDERWISHNIAPTVYRSTIVVPLSVGEETIGALLLYHTQPNQFAESQIDAVQAAANQFAVSINNGELFSLIRDQAAGLGNMLRAQQVEASRSTAMLEGVADGVLVTDASNTVTLFNESAEKILEIPQTEIVGKSLEHFMGLFGAAGQSWITTIRTWAEQRVKRDQSEIHSEQIMLDDGRVVSVNLAPVSANTEFLGTVSIFRDITHEVEVDRLKSEFVATVSHELRTPMTPIKGYVEFLMMGGAGDLNEEQVKFMSIIKSNIDRLAVLVNDLLDISRIEAGKVGLNLQPLNIVELTEAVLQNAQQKAVEEERHMEFVLDTAGKIPSVFADKERVHQILTNLVDNGYRYTETNGMIKVQILEIANHIQVNIQDTGIGIFPDEQDRIFERFYRGENHLVFASAGTGLGLSIVRELIEMHNGRIWVESAGIPGEGSIFSFVLPVYDPNKEINPKILEG